MPIDTKAVQGRRELTFESLDEVVADAEQLVASPHTKVLGNWPLGQLLSHLAKAINGSIDGISARAPWYIRFVGRLMKGRFLRNKMSPGFQLPEEAVSGFFPVVSSPHEALDCLRAAVLRTRTQRMTGRHPVFGKLTHEEWYQLHLRHCELHLSFARPD